MFESTTRALNQVMESHVFGHPSSFSEEFAIKRFQKKFQKPDLDEQQRLHDECWETYIQNEKRLASLPTNSRPLSSEWYILRDFLHRELKHFNLYGGFRLPKGSEFIPTRGFNSVEARLTKSIWTTTADNLELFAEFCYQNASFRRAVRRRFSRIKRKYGWTRSELIRHEKWLYEQSAKYVPEHLRSTWCFYRKVEVITTVVNGSRFTTVPKNNTNRRPINVEPFGNTLTQSVVGEFLRAELRRIYGLDLDRLACTHRFRIQNLSNATIDLKNASDSISLRLVEFLMPARVLWAIKGSRSPMVFGSDGHYHVLEKVSSMGNGFTFELMSLILNGLCRLLDPKASVFGDDIIIKKEKALQLKLLLEEVGFVVNSEKSFVDGPFRESCGANYHRDEGYIESYDFEWNSNIGEACTTWNKIVRLAQIYPQFSSLKKRVSRIIPQALHAGPDWCFQNFRVEDTFNLDQEQRALVFPPYFVTSRPFGDKIPYDLRSYCYPKGDYQIVKGIKYVEDLRTPTTKTLVNHKHWGKYLMYLYSGRATKDVVTGAGHWVSTNFVKVGSRAMAAKDLKDFILK